jgi:hypothetical protein
MVSSIQASSSAVGGWLGADRLVVAWQNPVAGGAIVPIGLIEKTDRGYTFAYFQRARHLPGFRPLLGLGEFDRSYESLTLFPVFRQRLMDSRRPDYGRYLEILGLPRGANALRELGRSGGRRAGDSIFMVPEPHIEEDGRTTTNFFVHGPRHQPGAEARIASLRPGETLELRDEPANPVNQHALLVTSDGATLGYVPDLLVDYARTARAHSDVAVTVIQVNGPEAPPNLRLRVHLEGYVPEGYLPFRGEGWELAWPCQPEI